MNIASLIVGLLIGIALVVFGAQNAQPVTLHVFGWESSAVPLVLALGIAMLTGAVLTLLFSIPGRVRGRRRRRALERELEDRGAPAPSPLPPAPVPASAPMFSSSAVPAPSSFDAADAADATDEAEANETA